MKDLELGGSGEKCSCCEMIIPKDVKRISFNYKSQYNLCCHKRVCGLCILKLAKNVDLEPIEEWKKKLFVKGI